MPLFSVIAQPSGHGRLHEVVPEKFPADHLVIIESLVWVVSCAGTAQELSATLGITDGTNGSAVVLEVGGYFGRANPNIWTWMKNKWEASSRG